ncbi:unnamed protein product [Choristocarpus tenellus]
MLADVLELRLHRFAMSRSPHWGVFEHERVYFEIFCMAFGLLDHVWTSRKASRDQFGNIIGHVKGRIEDLLQTAPASLEDFMREAAESNLLH